MHATDESLSHWLPKGTTSTVVASLRRHTDNAILWDRSIPLESRSVLRKILACRDGSFGSNTYRCGGCWERGIVYSPCGNRHCPDCGWARSNLWLKKILDWRLPCCIMHVVFTSPHELNPIFEMDPAACYPLYFRCVRETLLHITSKQYQCLPGIVMALHTWGQRMNLHVHIHVIMTSGGMSIPPEKSPRKEGTDESKIETPQSRWVEVHCTDKAMNPENLANEFRKRFLRGLQRLHSKGKLELPRTNEFAEIDSPEEFSRWLEPLSNVPWMVDSQETSNDPRDAERVHAYMSKYVYGAVIRDSRMLADDGEYVTIGIRDYRNNCRSEFKMHGSDFVRNFLLHIVPSGVSRIRYAGIFRPQIRKATLAQCRKLIEATSTTRLHSEDKKEDSIDQASQREFRLPEEMISFSEDDTTQADQPILHEERRLPTCKRCGTPEMIPEGFQNWMETRDSIQQVRWLIGYFALIWTSLDEMIAKSKMKNSTRQGQLFFADWFLDQRFIFAHTEITIDSVSDLSRTVVVNACTFDSLDPSLPLPNW